MNMKRYNLEEAKELLRLGQAEASAEMVGAFNFTEIDGDQEGFHLFESLEGRGLALVDENSRLKYSPVVMLED